MADQVEHPEDGAVPKRGEAKWKEAKERVAECNSQARKAGKRRREAYERQRAEVRGVAERRQMADLLGKRKTP